MTTKVSSLQESSGQVAWSDLSPGDAFIDESTDPDVLFFKMNDKPDDEWNTSSFSLGEVNPTVNWWTFKADDMVTQVNVDINVRKKA
jgi:hypothetical protein